VALAGGLILGIGMADPRPDPTLLVVAGFVVLILLMGWGFVTGWLGKLGGAETRDIWLGLAVALPVLFFVMS
jgi:hypothetical protein